jgi:predicted HicB family RNase H-like nuclease
MTMTKTFLIRCTPQELDIWKEQAWEERLSLNKWIRRRLHGVAVVAPSQRGRYQEHET